MKIKNYNKGFMVQGLIAIVALVFIVVGAYWIGMKGSDKNTKIIYMDLAQFSWQGISFDYPLIWNANVWNYGSPAMEAEGKFDEVGFMVSRDGYDTILAGGPQSSGETCDSLGKKMTLTKCFDIKYPNKAGSISLYTDSTQEETQGVFDHIVSSIKMNAEKNKESLKDEGSTADESLPHINSISPTSGPIGSSVALKGSNFNGFEGDLYAWIENQKTGEKGIIYNDKGATKSYIPFTLKDKYCTRDNSYSGGECPLYMKIVPGIYNISVYPWGKESNKVTFTVTNEPTIPSIVIIYPNGEINQTLKVGQKNTLYFSSIGNLGTKTIKLNSYSDDGVLLNSYYIGTTQNESEFNFTIPSAVEVSRFGPNYKFQILVDKYNSGKGVADESDNYFSIIK